MPKRIVFIGSGNVASHLAPAMEKAGLGSVIQVYSRNIESAEGLAAKLQGASATNVVSEIIDMADVYIISLVDDAMLSLIGQFPENRNALWLHTSGSVEMSVLSGLSERYGVFYPLQTFSKGVAIDVAKVPLFIEGCDASVEESIREFASPLFGNIYHADSAKRRMMHIAAVFGCNFVNYLWTLASDILEEAHLPFEVLKPLLEETMRKAFAVSPGKGQTGPAVRGDIAVMEKHLSQLSGQSKELYEKLSAAIMIRYSCE